MLHSWITMFNKELRSRPSPPTSRDYLQNTVRVLTSTSTASMMSPLNLRNRPLPPKSNSAFMRLDSTGQMYEDHFDCFDKSMHGDSPKVKLNLFGKDCFSKPFCMYPKSFSHVAGAKNSTADFMSQSVPSKEFKLRPSSPMKPTVVQASGVFHTPSISLESFPIAITNNNHINMKSLHEKLMNSNNFGFQAQSSSSNSSHIGEKNISDNKVQQSSMDSESNRCGVKLEINVHSGQDSAFKLNCSHNSQEHSSEDMDMEVTIVPVLARKSQRKKCRPSAKKRRRTQQKRDQSQPTITQCVGNSSIKYDQPSSCQFDCKDYHIDENFKTEFGQNSSPSFQITFVDVSSSSADTSSSSPILNDVASSRLSFVISASDLESSSDDTDDEHEVIDDNDLLWESLTNQATCNPLSLSVTYISRGSNSFQEKQDLDTEGQCSSPTDVSEANKRWDLAYGKYNTPGPPSKVNFPKQKRDLQIVHPMHAWSYAYQAARRGPWEEIARDHERFQKKISDIESAIHHVFNKDHRTKVYEKYFV